MKPKLLDQVRQAIRARHYSYGTEKACIGWIKRFIFFHKKRHPAEMGEAESGQFLSSRASEAQVSAATQNQALKDIDFLSNHLVVHGGKGDKDRITMLPVAVQEPLRRHQEEVKLNINEMWEMDAEAPPLLRADIGISRRTGGLCRREKA